MLKIQLILIFLSLQVIWNIHKCMIKTTHLPTKGDVKLLYPNIDFSKQIMINIDNQYKHNFFWCKLKKLQKTRDINKNKQFAHKCKQTETFIKYQTFKQLQTTHIVLKLTIFLLNTFYNPLILWWNQTAPRKKKNKKTQSNMFFLCLRGTIFVFVAFAHLLQKKQ